MFDFVKKWRCINGILTPVDLSRRRFLGGLGALITAPALVQIQNIMPVKALVLPDDIPEGYEFVGLLDNPMVAGEMHRGKWRLFGIPTFESNPELSAPGWKKYGPFGEKGSWRSYKGSWLTFQDKGPASGQPYKLIKADV